MIVTRVALRRRIGKLIIPLFLGFATANSQGQQNGVLREVWTDISGNNIEYLLASPSYPTSPTIKDVLPSFSAPGNFGSNFGTRLRATLTPTLSGNYRFWIQGDDQCSLSIDGSPIASVPSHTSTSQWDKYPEQQSSLIALVAGQSYSLEALHKESWGGDHITVNWSLEGTFERSVIPQSVLTTPETAPDYDPTKQLYISAGADRDTYLPAATIELTGSAFLRSGSSEDLTIAWTQTAGATATIENADTLTPFITTPTPGDYTFTVTVSNETDTRTDEVTISVNPPLAANTGTFIQEIWLGLGGSNIEHLINSSDYPTRPHLVRNTNTLAGPRNWGDQYGVRTRGLITPPETGDYTFYVMGDESTALFLSDSADSENIELIAFTPERTKENAWTQFPEQKSETIHLVKGSKYYLELLFRETWSADFHGVAWSKDGGAIQILGGEFFIAQSPESTSAPDYNAASTFVVEAGTNQTLYSPDSSSALKGKTLKINDSYEVASIIWTQLSGPATATISLPDALETAISLPSEGVYTFQLSVTANETTATDVVTVSRLPAISANTGGFTREVWLNLSGGSVENLTDSPRFPSNPDIVDQIPSLTGPINWGSKYGSRSSGYLVPTRTGPHTFYLTADDSAVLKLSPNANRSAAATIASSGRRSMGDFRDESQTSAPINLVAGQRYYIEVLHKQNYSGDHFQASWSFGDENAPLPIGGGNLEPFTTGITPLNTALVEYAYAGPDRHYYAPTAQVDLSGKILKVTDNDPFHNVQWTYTGSTAGVAIDNASELTTHVALPEVGQYTFRLSLDTNDDTHFDEVTIEILPALSNETEGLLRAVWLNSDGSTILDLLENDPLLINPTFEDILPNLETPSSWADYYGTRLVGYIHAPTTGEYQFWIAANDSAQLRISTSDQPADSELVAEVMRGTSRRDWERYDSQTSEPITLEAGEKYFVEVLHKEGRNSDNLAVAWTGPGLNDREVITAGYLSPAYDAPAFAEDILVMAGEDQTISWPDNTASLFARVYDQVEGPEVLRYQWTSENSDVVFEFPNTATTDATFPSQGTYNLTLTVTDGKHTASDSLTVTVAAPLSANAGSITREVWLNIPGRSVSDLTNSPNFPDNPDIVDTLPSFDAPRDWEDNYGTRIRGYILAPTTGAYQFYVSADDHVQVSLNTTNETFNNLTEIINVEGYTYYLKWDHREEQASATIQLTAGQRYPIELLHKESTGGDHVALAWKRPGSEEIEVVIGNFLEPAVNAPAASQNLIVIAPEDIQQRWPQNTVNLHGKAFDLAFGPETLRTRWEQVSGPGNVTFAVTQDLETSAHVSEPGEYTLRLYANDGSEEIFDTMQITLDAPLSTKTGAATRSTFTEISGNRIVDMLDSEKYPSFPDATEALINLNANDDLGDNYGTLVTGFLHTPATGAYRFSVTGDDWAELWLSTDENPDNKILICFTPRATDYYEWDMYPEYQTSTEIQLVGGQKYYVEIRHKQHGWRDHFAVAWLRPDEDEMTIIQGAYLSPTNGGTNISAPQISITGNAHTTLYVGETYVDPGFAATDGNGSNITNQVVVDNHVDTEHAGSYSVRYQVINPSTGFAETVVRTVDVITANSAPANYIAPTSATPANVTWTEPAPAAITAAEASRFLAQATFGPTKESIAHLQEIGYTAWINEQITLPASLHREQMQAIKPVMDEIGYRQYNHERVATWWTSAITAPDQLRQRFAFALSEVIVLSDKNTFGDHGQAVANFYDILLRYSFGDYREMMEEVTLNPMMGQYLTMLRSTKEQPDENYPREIMQLFSIGLNMLNPDGTPILNENDAVIPTYDQRVILELSRAFTGWSYAGSQDFNYSHYKATDYFSPMVPFEEQHDFGSKELMGGFTLPRGLTPTEDLKRSLDHIASHPNVGPFLAIRLIQRLTTSNPSPAYVYRVAKAFDNDGTGKRGNFAAVVKAILLDPEAREPETYADEHFGKLREPIVRLTHLLRSFEATTSSNAPVLGRYPITSTTSAFGQAPFQAPSVFNFFLPDYAPPGEIMNAGLVAPEFATTTELTAVDTTNFLHRVIDREAPLWYRYSAHIQPNLEHLIANAKDTNAVLDEIELLLMAGSMSTEMRAILKTTIDAMDDPEARAYNALKLIISSPEFSIQK